MIGLYTQNEEKDGLDQWHTYYKKMMITLNLLNAILAFIQ